MAFKNFICLISVLSSLLVVDCCWVVAMGSDVVILCCFSVKINVFDFEKQVLS